MPIDNLTPPRRSMHDDESSPRIRQNLLTPGKKLDSKTKLSKQQVRRHGGISPSVKHGTRIVGSFLLFYILALMGRFTSKEFSSEVVSAYERRDDSNSIINTETRSDHEIVVPPMLPLMINVGQGTTATNVFFYATCNLNLTSIHWNKFCLSNGLDGDIQQLSESQKIALAAHNEARNAYRILSRDCMTNITRFSNSTTTTSTGYRGNQHLDSKCSIKETIEVMRRLKEAVITVITSGGVQVLHDSPYPMMADFIRKERSKHYHQITKSETVPIFPSTTNLKRDPKTFFILSKRNPSDWVQSRIEHQKNQLFCRAFFNEKLAANLWQKYENKGFDPFDLDFCLNYTLSQNPVSSETAPQLSTDVFVTYKSLVEEAMMNFQEKRNKKKHLEKQQAFIEAQMRRIMDAAQEYHLNHTIFNFDLFDVDEPLDDSDLANKIATSLPTMMLPKNVVGNGTLSLLISQSAKPGERGGLRVKKFGSLRKIAESLKDFYQNHPANLWSGSQKT